MTHISDEMIDTMLSNSQAVSALQGVATELGQMTAVGDMSRDEVRTLIATVVARQQAAETVAKPQVPEEAIDQLLADPEAVSGLQELARHNGIDTPVAEMTREQQRALIEAMMVMAQQAQQQGGMPGADMGGAPSSPMPGAMPGPMGGNMMSGPSSPIGGAPSGEGMMAPGSAPTEIPAGLVDQVFGDERTQELLERIMKENNLPGTPADLPMEMKTAIVKMLIDQGVIGFGPGPSDA